MLKPRFFKVFWGPESGPRIENWVPKISKHYHRILESEKIGFLESENSGPYRSIPSTIIFLKQPWLKHTGVQVM